MNSSIYIKTSRQRRALEALLEKAISVKDLGPKIGALNPRQIIFELRGQGFQRIIKTRRFEVTDQDGKQCHPGEYYIPQELKPIVEKVLNENVVLALTKCLEATEQSSNSNINGRSQ